MTIYKDEIFRAGALGRAQQHLSDDAIKLR